MVVDGVSYSGSADIHQIVPGSFVVSFSSDYSNTYSGFNISWECHVTTTTSTTTTTTPAPTPTGDYHPPQTGTTGTIQLHNYTNDHSQGRDVNIFSISFLSKLFGPKIFKIIL